MFTDLSKDGKLGEFLQKSPKFSNIGWAVVQPEYLWSKGRDPATNCVNNAAVLIGKELCYFIFI